MDSAPPLPSLTASANSLALHSWRLWVLSLGTWTAISLVGALRATSIYVVPDGAGPGRVVGVPWLTQFVAFEWVPNLGWALLTPLVVGLGRRFPLVRGRLSRHLPLHAAAALLVGLTYVTAYAFVGSDEAMWPELVLASQAREVWGRRAAQNLSQYVVLYFVVLAAGAALDLWARQRAEERERAALALRASRLEADLTEARLAALRAQLHPHFLFNTLHAVSALVDWRPSDARRMLTDLADLLRLTLAQSASQTVRLDDDLDWLERYLDLQLVRFEDRLHVEVDVDPEALDAEVPALVLQPLVENALVHGVAAVSRPCRVWIRAERGGPTGGRLRLTVEDDGAGLADAPRDGVGVGNTRARLDALYGPGALVTISPRPGGGVRSVVELPYRPAAVRQPESAPAEAAP